MPLRIGTFTVYCFHNLSNAPAIHAELKAKKAFINAAVLDHAYILSPLHLAAAVYRVESSKMNYTATAPSPAAAHSIPSTKRNTVNHRGDGYQQLPAPTPASIRPASPHHRTPASPSTAKSIFLSLSLTHNLDRILQVLPPGPATTAVVIVVKDPCPESSRLEAEITAAVQCTNPAAAAHELPAMGAPFWLHPALHHVEAAKVTTFYGIAEAALRGVRQGLSRGDQCCMAAAVGVPIPPTTTAERERWEAALRWRSLELCVVTRLAAYDS